MIDLLRTRRSIRQFENRAIEQDKIDILVEAVLRSPSSRGSNPWEFVVVSNPETLEQLSHARAAGSTFLKHAPLAFVVCADPEKSDVWIEDTSIATLLLHLTAHNLGLGSCWIQLRQRLHESGRSSEQFVREVLGLKDGLVTEAMVAIGYPAEKKPGRENSTLLYDRVSYERYGQKR